LEHSFEQSLRGLDVVRHVRLSRFEVSVAKEWTGTRARARDASSFDDMVFLRARREM
jgi:hypothetical protein